MFPMQGNQPDDKLYVDDVFSAYTYTGNGSTQTITNGIDLAGKGGLVWLKQRTGANGHNLYNSAQGATNKLATNETNASSVVPTGLTAFSSSGFSLGAFAETNLNASSFVSWTFSKAPKFFDVVTVSHTTGTGTSVSFSSLSTIGMVISKRTDSTSNWVVWHRSTGNGNMLQLETTAASFANASAHSVSGTTVTLSSSLATGTYVVYAFAHDTATDGIVQCGTVTANGSGVIPDITLGWEPQFVIKKRIDSTSSWSMTDISRAFITVGNGENGAYLYANSASQESISTAEIGPKSTGIAGTIYGSANAVYIYLAIRRPNKPPTVGTQVYNAIARTGTGAAATVTGVGFAPDLAMTTDRLKANYAQTLLWDRLRGPLLQLATGSTVAELSVADSVASFGMDGVTVGASRPNAAGCAYINHFFKRAVGVFDVVCDTGTGAAHTISHNLTVVPELMIRKGRSGATQWEVFHSGIANTEKLILNSTAAKATDTTAWNSTSPTASVFTVGTGANVNTNTATYVAYLFATLAGISKVGSYTGNGTSQTINCGFTTGARFILIKRTDATGDWYVWDTVRGIIAGNDPHLSLNTTVAEVTSDDSIDPASSGFIVNQLAATNINVTSASYVFLAIA